jgi:SAM-dependent methyltransferase
MVEIQKIADDRWGIAQKSERRFWEGYTNQFFEEERKSHKRKAQILEEEWKKQGIITLNKNTKILQVGCGPEDVINYFSNGKKYAIDPLANFYKERFKLDYKNVNFTEGRGEKLPFEDETFDLVLLTNVLDHVESPEKVLSEIRRVLKKNGVLFFEMFIYQKNFRKIAKIYGKIKELVKGEIFNIHHPYMFIRGEARQLVKEYFLIEKEELGRSIFDDIKDMDDLKFKTKHSERFNTRIPAYFGLYGYINYTMICKKL